MHNIPNQETAIMNLLQSNPQLGFISTLLHNGNSLEGIAKSMAATNGVNINQLIN